MKLYFSPLACSMATRIALYETGQTADFVEVDPHSESFRAVNSLGLVPVLEKDDGTRLTENAAILQDVGGAQLAPRDPQLHQWLSFIGTELHKGIYGVLLDKDAPPDAKAYALSKAKSRLDWTSERLAGRDFVLDRFTVADAYLVTVLGWSVATPIDLSKWPVLMSYVARLRERPTVARALSEEFPMWAKKTGTSKPPQSVRAVMDAFNDVFQSHDPSALDALVADDCVIENTHPAPNGGRFEGRAACIGLWKEIATTSSIRFDVEDVDVMGDRALIRWRLHRNQDERDVDSLRGVNVMRVREGKIVEALGYVKGA